MYAGMSTGKYNVN